MVNIEIKRYYHFRAFVNDKHFTAFVLALNLSLCLDKRQCFDHERGKFEDSITTCFSNAMIGFGTINHKIITKSMHMIQIFLVKLQKSYYKFQNVSDRHYKTCSFESSNFPRSWSKHCRLSRQSDRFNTWTNAVKCLSFTKARKL